MFPNSSFHELSTDNEIPGEERQREGQRRLEEQTCHSEWGQPCGFFLFRRKVKLQVISLPCGLFWCRELSFVDRNTWEENQRRCVPGTLIHCPLTTHSSLLSSTHLPSPTGNKIVFPSLQPQSVSHNYNKSRSRVVMFSAFVLTFYLSKENRCAWNVN